MWLEGEAGGEGLWWHYGLGVIGERVDKPEQTEGIAGSNTEEGLLGCFKCLLSLWWQLGLQRANGTAWPEGVVASPEISAPLVSPGKVLGGGTLQVAESQQPTSPPLSLWFLCNPTSPSILPPVTPLSLYPPNNPCGKQGRELPFQDGTCPFVPARPLEDLTGQHFKICSPRIGWEPLSKVSLVLSPHVTGTNELRTGPAAFAQITSPSPLP